METELAAARYRDINFTYGQAVSEMKRNVAKKLYNPRVEYRSGGAARSLLSLSLFRRVPSGERCF